MLFLCILSGKVSGTCSLVKPGHSELTKSQFLVEASGKVLVASGYTDYAKHLSAFCPKSPPKNTCKNYAVTCRMCATNYALFYVVWSM